MKVYDCFLFFNEFDIIEMRLNILKNKVDHFVLCESTRNFRGQNKPLYFDRVKEKYKDFPITHLVFDDSGPFPYDGKFGHEQSQREYLGKAINPMPDDIVILSDCDEIWDPVIVDNFLNRRNKHEFRRVRVRHFVYYLNLLLSNRMNGPVIMTGEYFINTLKRSMARARTERRHGPAMSLGGWHFSCTGGADAVYFKVSSYSHSEHEQHDWPDLIERRAYSYSGKERLATVVKIDETYPAYIRENQEKYDRFIYRYYDDSDDPARTRAGDALDISPLPFSGPIVPADY